MMNSSCLRVSVVILGVLGVLAVRAQVSTVLPEQRDLQLVGEVDLVNPWPDAIAAWDSYSTAPQRGALGPGQSVRLRLLAPIAVEVTRIEMPAPVVVEVPATLTQAERADMDGDGDVDFADQMVFQNCFNGPNQPPRCE